MEEKTSYLGAMLKSQGNLYAVLGAGAVAVLASIPFGMVGAVLPLLALVAGEGLAALVVPDLPSFRAKVDEDARRNQRANVRQTIIEEIAKRIPIVLYDSAIGIARNRSLSDDNETRLNAYNTMIEQIRSLSQVAQDRRSQLGPREIERLYEASIDFLSLWLGRLVIDAREQSADTRELTRKMAEIDRQLQSATGKVASQLRQARQEYSDMIDRRTALSGKSAAIDAALTAMPDKIEEIYQMVIAAPYSTGMGDKLEDSLSRLRMAEELEQELSLEIPSYSSSHTAAPPVASTPSKARAASRQSTLS